MLIQMMVNKTHVGIWLNKLNEPASDNYQWSVIIVMPISIT